MEGSSSDYETDEEWEVERKKQAAIMEKDKVEMSCSCLSCKNLSGSLGKFHNLKF